MLMCVKQTVENVGGTVLGVVLNNVDLRTDSQYQYYTSYYTYYTPGNAASPVVSQPGARRKQAAPAAKTQTAAASAPAKRGDLF